MVKQLHPPIKLEPFLLEEMSSSQLTAEEAYRKWLFHGPLFHRIDQIESVGKNGIIASLLTSSPQECITGDLEGQWLIDPMIIDGGLQLVMIWARLYKDMMLLPSRVSVYRHFGSFIGPKINCQVNIRCKPESTVTHSNLAFIDGQGRLLGLLEDVEAVCSTSLNRLTRTDIV